MAQYLELDSGTIYRDIPDGVSEEELIQRLEKDLEVVPDNILGLLKPQIEEKEENQLQDLMLEVQEYKEELPLLRKFLFHILY